MAFTFQKQEKLKHKKLIEQLFKEGKSISKFPLRLVYLQINHDGDKPLQAGFSVPKRNFKHAVDRNLLKRRIREAYRLNKEEVYKEISNKYILMFIYLDKNIKSSDEIHPIMEQLLQSFVKTIN
ncbi:MAG: ribonuclease P protein component [Flavobacteriales bacterium]|jgi:ribonuclease P protein component|nr:ribonuclease P protein component [Flavobacteriales bacterium]